MPLEAAKWEQESAVFKAFLEAEPKFAGRSIANWKHNENDTPDITAVDSGSKTIGVELVEWIPEEWISNFARWLRLLERVEVPKGWSVRLHIPDARSRCFEAGDRSNISAELSAVIRNHAPREPAPKVSATTIKSVPVDANVLSSQAPKLSAFCDLLMFCNFGFRHSIDFETAPLREDAEAALRAAIEKKTTNPIYKRKKGELKLDHLVLLVHGSDALMMNEFLSHSEVQSAAASVMEKNPGAFDLGFVMTYTNPWLALDVQTSRIFA
ncbi:MAG: hypothetical protein WCA59_11700 [Candidatus Binataceae bacterium]